MRSFSRWAQKPEQKNPSVKENGWVKAANTEGTDASNKASIRKNTKRAQGCKGGKHGGQKDLQKIRKRKIKKLKGVKLRGIKPGKTAACQGN